jgi:light-independent protochlorophyllide reductase subunit B
MKLAYWMYTGPAHIGTLRVASSFKNVHAIMHAPLGDDYFNVMKSMLERERDFTPVTTSIVDRKVLARGSQEKVVQTINRKMQEEQPDLILVTPTCTSSILQEDLDNFVKKASENSNAPVILADVNHYRINEIQAADRTLEQTVRYVLTKAEQLEHFQYEKTLKPSVNILGMFSLGFHNQHDCRELKRLLRELNIEVNEIIPDGCTIENLKNLPKAWFNIIPYREVGLMTARYLEEKFNMPYVSITPMGFMETSNWLNEIAKVLEKFGLNSTSEIEKYKKKQTQFFSQSAWFSRSIDCQNLIGKKAVVFGDVTHSVAMIKILSREMGIKVACGGTYCKHDADWFREQVEGFCDEVLITDDHTQVASIIEKIKPSAIFGTQMERHIGKKLEIPCGVISAPIHIQNFPLSYKPFLGYEGTNQISDLVYNSFNLGMEEHLLEIFGGHDTKTIIERPIVNPHPSDLNWSAEAIEQLNQIPKFVRGKVKENTEQYARNNNFIDINLDILYDAKKFFS